MDNSRSQFTMKLLVTGTTHPISLREKLTFLHSAAFCTLGSLQSFAALYANVRIWSVVFYKKLIAIPPPDHPRRAAGRGIYRGYNASSVGNFTPSTISRLCASDIPAE